MCFRYVNKSKTKYNPSVIEYSSRYQLFICGSYELFDDKAVDTIDDDMKETLKRVNNRFGNLSLITRTNVLIEEFECFDGGVFDLKLIHWNGMEDNIIAVHSNSFATIYSIDSSNKIQTIRRYETNSSLLTSLTPITDELIIVANSEGRLVLIDASVGQTSELSVTKSCEPIWCLLCHRMKDTFVLFVGSDDSLWRVFCAPQMSAEDMRQMSAIHVNRDAMAGITAFATNRCSDNGLSLIVGSYDEFIRFYSIEFNENQINVCLRHRLHVNGSGIWRIIVKNDTLLVSGMYSGAHIITADMTIGQTLDPLEHKTTDDELIYGLSCDPELKSILMASFYTKTIYLFRD